MNMSAHASLTADVVTRLTPQTIKSDPIDRILNAVRTHLGTEIAFAAKRVWGYPEVWIRLWADSLTVSAEEVEGCPAWLARVDLQSRGDGLVLAVFSQSKHDGANRLLI